MGLEITLPSIWILGDVHGDFRHILRALSNARRKPADLIFLGDLELSRPFEEEIGPIEEMGPRCWAIHGNHDADSEETSRFLFGSPAFAERSLHGRVVEIGGLRVAGLGGVFEEMSWLPPGEPIALSERDLLEDVHEEARRGRISPEKARGIALKAKSAIFWEDWERLYGQPADILVTHEAPSCHPKGNEALDDLARSMGARWAFHGHHHDRLDSLYLQDAPRFGFLARGVGLRGITAADGSVILPGLLDERRMARGQDR